MLFNSICLVSIRFCFWGGFFILFVQFEGKESSEEKSRANKMAMKKKKKKASWEFFTAHEQTL